MIPPLPAAPLPTAPPADDADGGRADEVAGTAPSESPLHDHLLELEQEFQDQQDQGKLSMYAGGLVRSPGRKGIQCVERRPRCRRPTGRLAAGSGPRPLAGPAHSSLPLWLPPWIRPDGPPRGVFMATRTFTFLGTGTSVACP